MGQKGGGGRNTRALSIESKLISAAARRHHLTASKDPLPLRIFFLFLSTYRCLLPRIPSRALLFTSLASSKPSSATAGFVNALGLQADVFLPIPR